MEILAQNARYYATLAITEEEIEEVFRIRYQVFYEELDEGEYREDGKEQDLFDQYCDFIIIKEKSNHRMVGLYRVLPYFKMDPEIGFYTNMEFDLSALLKDDRYSNSVAELGRLAILKDHRGGTNLLLLWNGLVKYCKKNGIRYLLGCGSLPADTEKSEVEILYYQLEAKQQIVHDPIAPPRPPSEIRELSEKILNKAPNEKFMEVPDDVIELEKPTNLEELPEVELPNLIRRYQTVGSKIIGKPAFDSYDFGCYDFLVMIDLHSIKARISYAYVQLRLFLNRLRIM